MNQKRRNFRYALGSLILIGAGIVGFQNCGKGFIVQTSTTLTGGSNQSLSSSSSIDPSTITTCAPATICFNGKSVSFKNDNGAPTTIQLISIQDHGFVLRFTTPKGRTITQQFSLVNGNFYGSAVAGSYPQFCMNHTMTSDNRCSLVTINGLQEFNCASALHWYGSFTGDTVSQQAICGTTTVLPPVTATVPVTQTLAAANQAAATNADVTQRLNDPTTSDAEKQVITGLENAPTGAPGTNYTPTSSPAADDLPQLSAGCSGRQDISTTPVAYGPSVPLLTLPFRQILAPVDTNASCVPYGQWCSISYRGNANGNTCSVFTNLLPKYNCTASWVLTCKQFCESVMGYLNLPAGHGWTCNYGAYYDSTPNHDPNTYKETDRRGASWDL